MNTKKIHYRNRQSGFSLVEMAVVIVILGLVLATLIMPIQAQRAVHYQSNTEQTLISANASLIGFAQTEGRLPCPATDTSNGLESPIGGGICTVKSGFLPASTLGLQPINADGYALDAWSHPIRYSVDQSISPDFAPATAPDFTTDEKMNAVGVNDLEPALSVCAINTNCSVTNYLANNAVAVILSTGENYRPATPGSPEYQGGVDEITNLNPNTTTFFSREPTGPKNSTTEFDDIVIWISPYILYNNMIQAGRIQ